MLTRAKIASWSAIGDLVIHDGAGVALDAEEIPDGGPPDELAIWFRLRQSGARWDELSDEKTFALYVSEHFHPGAATMLLYGDVTTIVGGGAQRPRPPGCDVRVG